MKEENFGKTGKDIITGFEGIITGYCSYISGCAQYLLVQRVAADNVSKDGQWVDISRVEIDETKEAITLPPMAIADNPGCDKAAPIR